jgi:hypothetical protein
MTPEEILVLLDEAVEHGPTDDTTWHVFWFLQGGTRDPQIIRMVSSVFGGEFLNGGFSKPHGPEHLRWELAGDYNWGEAFTFTQEPKGVRGCPCEGFTIADVEELLACKEGANEEDSWLAVGRLYDGRWFSLSAWCDHTGYYTGWD